MRKYKNNRFGPVLTRYNSTLEKRTMSQLYAWLLGRWEMHKKWATNDFLWADCPYAKYVTREQFDALIHEMKTIEGWN